MGDTILRDYPVDGVLIAVLLSHTTGGLFRIRPRLAPETDKSD
jgi:hypothetical protein